MTQPRAADDFPMIRARMEEQARDRIGGHIILFGDGGL